MCSAPILTHPTSWLQYVPRETRARAWALWRQVRVSGLKGSFAAWAAVYRRVWELADQDEEAAIIAANLERAFLADIAHRLGVGSR